MQVDLCASLVIIALDILQARYIQTLDELIAADLVARGIQVVKCDHPSVPPITLFDTLMVHGLAGFVLAAEQRSGIAIIATDHRLVYLNFDTGAAGEKVAISLYKPQVCTLMNRRG